MNVITNILNIIQQISSVVMPVFIFLLVFNSGISEHPKTILHTIKDNGTFYFRLIVYNNIALPIVIYLLVRLIPIDPVYRTGFIILFLSGGASTVIAFVQSTRHKITYAVSTMILLTISTVIILPLLLPFLVNGATISSIELMGDLFTSILIPLLLGASLRFFFETFSEKIKPYIQRIQKILMNVAIYGMMIGLIPELVQMIGEGVIVASIGVVLVAFAAGYGMEYNNSEKAMQLTSAFAGGQRNGAVAFAVVLNNFADPNVFLTVAITSTISTVLFSLLSSYMGKLRVKQA